MEKDPASPCSGRTGWYLERRWFGAMGFYGEREILVGLGLGYCGESFWGVGGGLQTPWSQRSEKITNRRPARVVAM